MSDEDDLRDSAKVDDWEASASRRDGSVCIKCGYRENGCTCDRCPEEDGVEVEEEEEKDAIGPTPWQVICPEHGPVSLARDQYDAQMAEADALWFCPRCGRNAIWDDDNYDAHLSRRKS
jgi:hypothetical protein